jgi:hypothetical protein
MSHQPPRPPPRTHPHHHRRPRHAHRAVMKPPPHPQAPRLARHPRHHASASPLAAPLSASDLLGSGPSPPSPAPSRSTPSPSSSTSSSPASSSSPCSARSTTSKARITHAGEYFALVLFGAVGMMFMTCSVELLMVFIGLEISSISTYIMAGFRKGRATASESSIKYFLLGSASPPPSSSTASPSPSAPPAPPASPPSPPASHHHRHPAMASSPLAMMIIGLGFKVSAAPFHVWTPTSTRARPPRRRPHVHRAQGRRLRRPAAHHLLRLPHVLQHRWVAPDVPSSPRSR